MSDKKRYYVNLIGGSGVGKTSKAGKGAKGGRKKATPKKSKGGK